MVGSVWMIVCVADWMAWVVGRVVCGPWLVRSFWRWMLVERAEVVFEPMGGEVGGECAYLLVSAVGAGDQIRLLWKVARFMCSSFEEIVHLAVRLRQGLMIFMVLMFIIHNTETIVDALSAIYTYTITSVSLCTSTPMDTAPCPSHPIVL